VLRPVPLPLPVSVVDRAVRPMNARPTSLPAASVTVSIDVESGPDFAGGRPGTHAA